MRKVNVKFWEVIVWGRRRDYEIEEGIMGVVIIVFYFFKNSKYGRML